MKTRLSNIRLVIDGSQPPYRLALSMTADVLTPVDEAAWQSLCTAGGEYSQALADAFAQATIKFIDDED